MKTGNLKSREIFYSAPCLFVSKFKPLVEESYWDVRHVRCADALALVGSIPRGCDAGLRSKNPRGCFASLLRPGARAGERSGTEQPRGFLVCRCDERLRRNLATVGPTKNPGQKTPGS